MIKKSFLLTISMSIFAALSANAQGTDTSMKPSVITGDVVAITASKLTIKTKTGPVDAAISAKTEFKRVPPDNPVLKAAVASSASEISVGDKLMVTGILAADGKSLPARSVYVMTQSELSQKRAKESEAWRTRGIIGKVASVNPSTGQIAVEQRSLMGATTSISVTPKADAKFIRYAPDSEKFDEAKASSLAEIKVGDNLRAIGDKAPDGTTMQAETILTGAFQTVAGTVVSIDAGKNEIVIKSLQTNKPVTVEVASTSVVKKFPEEMATRMAGMQMGGGGMAGGGVQVVRPAGAPPGGQAQPGPGQGPRPAGMGGRPGGGGIDEMIDRFPTIAVTDLKPGDIIAVSSTRNGNLDHIRAIKLLAGVEPFIKMAQMAQGAGGGRNGGGAPNFNIPGLDGVSFP
jgi:hypothetical protein